MSGVPNQQWKYIMVDMESGETVGTDEEKVAKEFARSDTTVVIEPLRCVTIEWRELEEEFSGNNIPEQQLFKF